MGKQIDPKTPKSAPDTPPAEPGDPDARLDEELEETFPASDPIPWIHDPPPKGPRDS
jgi:hypothetical protein